MARFDVEFTKTYEEYDGAFRPVDRTVETIEKTKRDGELVQVALIAVSAIIIVFVVAGAVVLTLCLNAR